MLFVKKKYIYSLIVSPIKSIQQKRTKFEQMHNNPVERRHCAIVAKPFYENQQRQRGTQG